MYFICNRRLAIDLRFPTTLRKLMGENITDDMLRVHITPIRYGLYAGNYLVGFDICDTVHVSACHRIQKAMTDAIQISESMYTHLREAV